MIIDLFLDSFLTREGKGDLFYSLHLYLIEDNEQQQGACCHVYTVPQFSTRQADRSTSVTKRLYFFLVGTEKTLSRLEWSLSLHSTHPSLTKVFFLVFFLPFFEYRRIFFFSTFVTHVSNPSNCLSIFKFDTDSVNFLVPQRHIQFKTGLNRVWQQ